MLSIREQKLLYHLTSLNNVDSILDSGLQPRSALNGFHDIADAEILAGRAEHGLDNYVLFTGFLETLLTGEYRLIVPMKTSYC